MTRLSTRRSRSGVSSYWADIIFWIISPNSPEKGRAPVSSSYNVTPSAQRSALVPEAPCSASGAMYSTVPMRVLALSLVRASKRATPKSSSFGVWSAVMNTFSGFTSR